MKWIVIVVSLVALMAGALRVGRPAYALRIARGALPLAVIGAMDSRYSGADVLGLSREISESGSRFEVALRVSGRRVDASFEPDGALCEEEREINADEMPDELRSALATPVSGQIGCS